ncbi:glycosyl transferase [Microbacterium sp. GXF7504]
MRFVWAVLAFVLAAASIGLGIAQRTVFQGPTTQSAQVEVAEEAPYTLIDGEAMGLLPGTQTLTVEGEGDVFVSYGRTADMLAWLSDQEFNHAVAEDGAVVVTAVAPDPDAATDAEAGDTGDEQTAEADAAATRNPSGSDLWLGEYSAQDSLSQPLQIPAEMSVLVASDGTAPAPSAITVTWPLDTATPWAGPLIVLGGVLLAVGIVLYLLGIRHARRSRGPRRKAPPPLEETQPIDVAVDGAPDKGVISATPRRRLLGRRSFDVVRRVRVPAVALLLAAPLAVSGCAADAWPQFGESPTPTPTETVVDAADQLQPAVTEAQAGIIMARIAETVAEADAARDGTLAATRLDGAALAARNTNYALRGAIEDYAALPAIPSEPLRIVLPQAYDEWPRTVLVVADQESSSTMMLLTQEDPWSNYKLVYTGALAASTELPKLAPWYIGAAQVPPDSTFLTIAPDQLAAAYADVLTSGADSRYASLFDEETDRFSQSVAEDRQRRLDEFNATATDTGTLAFGAAAGSQAPLALATVESGAIVAVTVNETDTVTPASEDVVIKLDNNPTVKALLGVNESQTGVTTTFADQLFFYVPAQGSNTGIRLLGYSSNILEAKVN